MSVTHSSVSKTWRSTVVLAIILLVIGAFSMAILLARPALSQGATTTLSGWLWSDNIGWISLNCADAGSCGKSNYAVSVDGSGNLSGWAWSDNIGWIDFNAAQLATCPQTQVGNTSCAPKLVSNAFSGWIRACAGTVGGDCASADRTDGWDGWISLLGTSPVAYGPTVNAGNGTMSGFAWGSTVVGWLQFLGQLPLSCQVPPDAGRCGVAANGENANAVYDSANNTMCNVCATSCSSGACVASHPVCTISDGNGGFLCIKASPSLIGSTRSVTVSWGVNYVQNNGASPACTVSGTNGNSWTSTAASSTPFASSGSQLSNPLSSSTTFTLSCLGSDNQQHTWTANVNVTPSFQER